MYRTGAVPPSLCVPEWTRVTGLVHGFLGRRGGVSCGAFAQLNLSSLVGDDPQAVEVNWQIAKRAACGLDFVRLRQVHGTRVLRASATTTVLGEGDASIVSESGLALAVLTADCVPILLVAGRQQVAAVVHAGWRGTLDGVLDSTVAEIERQMGVMACDLEAALGPAVAGCCYEVESELAERLATACDCADAVVGGPREGKSHVDLRRMNAARLLRLGLPRSAIHGVGPCTSCAQDQFFSHRRSGGLTGRQLSFIGWQR
ncbi:MAG: peptidoglycan editing factor PgeF [Deltaproteobacteria bacterium]|nr:peptidoglycan editing factor PgeF [Deltaproteobacteria bacterium]